MSASRAFGPAPATASCVQAPPVGTGTGVSVGAVVGDGVAAGVGVAVAVWFWDAVGEAGVGVGEAAAEQAATITITSTTATSGLGSADIGEMLPGDGYTAPAAGGTVERREGRMAEGPQTRARGAAPHRPMVRGRHVYLRPAERTDLPAFVDWLNDAETAAHLTARSPLSMALEERWFEGILERHGRDEYHFVICLLADGEPIGVTSLFDLDRANGQAGFGIVIGDEAMRGRGYGTDALDAIVDFGFGELRLERIWLDVFTDNAPAIRSYEKAGFSLEGTLRRSYYRRGAYRDAHRMSLVRSEWEALDRPKTWDLRTT